MQGDLVETVAVLLLPGIELIEIREKHGPWRAEVQEGRRACCGVMEGSVDHFHACRKSGKRQSSNNILT